MLTFNVCQELSNRDRNDISFIICSRDIDWRASKAHEFPWHSISDFKRLTVSGLTSNDADTLVRYWTSFGQNALGKLADYDHHMAVAKLLEAAQKESLVADGALLGALLKVRFGDGLDDYIRSLLLRLASQKATGACSLLHAFAYIAVIQNLELECLSRQVLAEVLYCSSSEVNSRVLPQLGMESAISSDGLFIMTRHREIAGRAVALLQDFDVDCDQLVLHLVNAVRSIMIKGEFLPEINMWHYALPDKLKSIGKAGLAIEIIRIFHKTQPANPYLLVKLSSLYREFGDPQSATNLFRNSDHLQNSKNLRVMLLEWGQAEAKARNPALGISLMLLSVADFVRVAPPSYTDLKIFFEITPVYLEILYSQFPRSEVSEAIIAASALGLEIGLPKESNRLMIKRLKRFGQRTTQDIKVEDEVMRLKDALIFTHELVDIDNRSIIEDLCSIDMTGYAKLADSIYDAIDAVENI